MKVDQIMTMDPTCCARSETAEMAANVMRDLNVGAIPIVESEQSYKLVGIVTDRDLCMKVVAEGKDASLLKLEDCMTSKLICCAPNTDLDDALDLMKIHHIRRLLVVDQEKRIEGIVSQSDLTRCAQAIPEDIESALKVISENSGPTIVNNFE